MVDQIALHVMFLGVIVFVGQIAIKSPVPLALVLVMIGMLLSLFPNMPIISLNPELVLNFFLPLLIYQISSFSSWQDMRKNLRPIALLSIGHTLFIAFLVASVIHFFIPALGWSLSLVLGAIISPPDDVAIVAIAEKIHFPRRLLTILEGEAILNDATALILFRLALSAMITYQTSIMHTASYLIVLLIAETVYGFVIGYVIGELRLRITNTNLHLIASLLTPFIAYLPPVYFGGSGIIATVVVGFIIGHRYAIKFTSEFRLYSRSIWPTLSFIIQSLLFLLVGLNMGFIIENLSAIRLPSLLFYGGIVIMTVVIGRFLWVYAAMFYAPKLFSRLFRKKTTLPPWQYLFVISWSGMRGAISLAAALAIPQLPEIHGVNPRDLLIFLVMCVIMFTLIVQGLTLPLLLNILGIKRRGQREHYNEHLSELYARLEITKAVLKWLRRYEQTADNPKLLHASKLYLQEYQMAKEHLEERILNHKEMMSHDQHIEIKEERFLLAHIIQVERKKLLALWRAEKINLTIRDRLLERLDHRIKNLPVSHL